MTITELTTREPLRVVIAELILQGKQEEANEVYKAMLDIKEGQ